MAVCDAGVPKASVAVGRECCEGNQNCGKSLLEKAEGMPTTTKCYRLCFQDFRRGLGMLRTVMSNLVTAANRECLHVSAGFESFGHIPIWLSRSAESWSVQPPLCRRESWPLSLFLTLPQTCFLCVSSSPFTFCFQ